MFRYLGASFAALLSASILASPINYSEAIDGGFSNVFTTFLDGKVGLNTISGQTGLDGLSDTPEAFVINLAPDLRIDSISFSATLSSYWNTPETLTLLPQVFLSGGGFNETIPTLAISDSAHLTIADAIFPLVPDYSSLNFKLNVSSSSSPTSNYYDYTWRVQISEVPLPATAWLFLSALAGLISIRKA